MIHYRWQSSTCSFLFFTFCVCGVSSYCLRQHLRWVSPLFATGSAALWLQRLSPVQHVVLHSQVHTKAPRCAKQLLSSFCLLESLWSFQNWSGGTFKPHQHLPSRMSPHFTSCLGRNEVTASYVKVSRHLPCCPRSKQTSVSFSN